MIDREWMATAMQDRYAEALEDEYDQSLCICGHSASQHRHVPRQYRRPDTDPCDRCNCLSWEERK